MALKLIFFAAASAERRAVTYFLTRLGLDTISPYKSEFFSQLGQTAAPQISIKYRADGSACPNSDTDSLLSTGKWLGSMSREEGTTPRLREDD